MVHLMAEAKVKLQATLLKSFKSKESQPLLVGQIPQTAFFEQSASVEFLHRFNQARVFAKLRSVLNLWSDVGGIGSEQRGDSSRLKASQGEKSCPFGFLCQTFAV